MKRTISAMVGKGSLNHNSREFYASNVDPSRSHLNIEFCREDIRDVYHELFDEAQKRFNAKQTRSDRRIENYYEKICSSKQEKPFHEIVLQIGNKDDTGVNMELAETAKQCFCGLLFHCVTPSLSVVNIFTEHPDVIHISSSEHFVSEQSLLCSAENAARYNTHRGSAGCMILS